MDYHGLLLIPLNDIRSSILNFFNQPGFGSPHLQSCQDFGAEVRRVAQAELPHLEPVVAPKEWRNGEFRMKIDIETQETVGNHIFYSGK